MPKISGSTGPSQSGFRLLDNGEWVPEWSIPPYLRRMQVGPDQQESTKVGQTYIGSNASDVAARLPAGDLDRIEVGTDQQELLARPGADQEESEPAPPSTEIPEESKSRVLTVEELLARPEPQQADLTRGE